MSVPALEGPAGLSSDTLDPPAPPHTMQEDQWSDGQTAETDDDRDIIEEVANHEDDLTIRPSKISNDKSHDMNAPSPPLPSPPESQDLPHEEEAETGSVHSLPIVQVTEPTSPTPMTSRSASATYPSSPTSLAPTSTSSLDRRARNRAAFDVSVSCQCHSHRAHIYVGSGSQPDIWIFLQSDPQKRQSARRPQRFLGS